jgi:putative flippase GtrA
MSMFVHMFKTADARYAIGAFVSWPVYGALYIAILKILDRYYAVASAISWIRSYAVVYAFQKYGTFDAMCREAAKSRAMRSP